MLTKIALAAALIVGPISASQAANTSKTSEHARASYAQSHVQQRPEANSQATGPVQPETSFEKSWFDFQDRGLGG